MQRKEQSFEKRRVNKPIMRVNDFSFSRFELTDSDKYVTIE